MLLTALAEFKSELSSDNMFYEKLNVEGGVFFRSELLHLTLKICNFRQSDLSGLIMHVVIAAKVNFDESNLDAINANTVEFNYSTFKKAHLRKGNFVMVSFNNVDLRNADVGGSFFNQVEIAESDLEDAKLCNIRQVYTSFLRSNLSRVDFSGAGTSDLNINESLLFDTKITAEQLLRSEFDCIGLNRETLKNLNIPSVDVSKLSNTFFICKKNTVIIDGKKVVTIDICSMNKKDFIDTLTKNIKTETQKAVFLRVINESKNEPTQGQGLFSPKGDGKLPEEKLTIGKNSSGDIEFILDTTVTLQFN